MLLKHLHPDCRDRHESEIQMDQLCAVQLKQHCADGGSEGLKQLAEHITKTFEDQHVPLLIPHYPPQ